MRYDQHRAFAELRDDKSLCHCGRLKRYRNCCKGLSPAATDDRIHELSLEQRTRLTVESVRYFLFDGKALDLTSREAFTADRVSQFYRYLSDLWPHRLRAIDAIAALKNTQTLSGFFVGDPRPETILKNVSRIALYSDRIFIPLPFHMPWRMRDDYDPVQHPEQFLQDTRRWAILTLLLAAGIDYGIVVFIPDPADFDQQLRDRFIEAGKRREREGLISVPPGDMAAFEEQFKMDYLRQFYSLPDETIVARIRETVGLADGQERALLAYVNQQRKSDPLFVHGVAEGNPLMMRSIPTIDETLLTCGLTNAFPFTDQSGKWAELRRELDLLPRDAETWSPLSKAFSECPLEFLNVEDTDLAFAIRRDGRLSSFRDFMRSLWKDIDGAPDEMSFSNAARNLADRLRHEHQVAVTEWKAINAKFTHATRRNVIGGAAGLSAALTVGGWMGVGLSFATFAMLTLNDGQLLRRDSAAYRARVPMSIFIDVARGQ